MQGIVLVTVLAIIVEALIEYAKSIGRAVASGNYKTAVTQIAAIIIAVVLCVMTGGDLFAVVGIAFRRPWMGMLLTGIIISRGANYVSDFMSRIGSAKGGN